MTKSVPCTKIKELLIQCLQKNKEIFGEELPELSCIIFTPLNI